MGTRILGAALAAMATASAVHGQLIHVDASAPPGGDGESWSTAFRELQDACNAAATSEGFGVVIYVAQGVYRARAGAASDAPFVLNPPSLVSAMTISIQGGFLGRQSATPYARDFVSAATVISADVNGDDGPGFQNRADNRRSMFAIGGRARQPRILLDGLILEGSEETAIDMSRPEVTYNGFVAMDCVFRANRGVNGGAARFAGHSDVRILRSRFEGNQAFVNGGAVWVANNAVVHLENCVLAENSALADGGAIWSDGLLEISRCTLGGNRAGGSGGAISGKAFVYESLLTGNTARVSGGAQSGATDLYQCTIVDNAAQVHGGGVHVVGPGWIQYCIFFGNTSPIGMQLSASSMHAASSRVIMNSIEGGDRGIELGNLSSFFRFGESLIDTPPIFMDRAGPDGSTSTWRDNNYRLSATSPLRDLAEPQWFVIPSDLDGNTRFVSSRVGSREWADLGCYESQVTLCPADIDADLGISVADLAEFLAAFEAGGYLGDVTGNGTTPDADGAVTVDDLLYFLARFELGC